MPPVPLASAFRDLESALLRRRFQQLDPVLRLEIAAIAALVAAFVGWQLRIPLDGIARSGGSGAAARALALRLLGLALLAAIAAGARYARRLRGPDRPEPAWLALPLPPPAIARHLAWDARRVVPWALVPALGALGAAVGLVPTPLLLLIAAAFVALLVPAGHAGCAIAVLLATPGTAAAGGVEAPWPDRIERSLALGPPETRAPRRSRARWRHEAPWRALWRKDLLIALRTAPVLVRGRSLIVVMALSALVWRLPVEPAFAHLAAFALALTAGALLAGWLIELAGADPFATLRGLPLGAAPVWGSRAAWALAGAGALAALHALARPALAPPALAVFLVWIAGAALALGVLGAQLGITLHPRADHARRVLGMSLFVAVAASLMIPLLGWMLLFAALLHSAFGLRRWSWPAGA
jgi:hypothetical protein